VHGTYLAIWQTERQTQPAKAAVFSVLLLPSKMTIQVNELSIHGLFDSRRDRPAAAAIKSVRVSEHEVEEHLQASRPRARLPLYQTKIEENGGAHGVVDWISGVGDVCNRVPEREIDPARPITPQQTAETKHSQLPTSAQAIVRSHKPESRRTALRRHCDFWDADGDGLIFPWDIYTGFHKLGFSIALCLWAAVSMPLCCSYSTQTSWLPDPLFTIRLDNIHRSRHGSTTATYDMEAEIDMRRFDAIFEKYADGKDYLTLKSLYDVWAGQCCANDWFGWFAGGLECECPWNNIRRNTADDIQGSLCTSCCGLKMGN
jgi:peroxygenase